MINTRAPGGANKLFLPPLYIKVPFRNIAPEFGDIVSELLKEAEVSFEF